MTGTGLAPARKGLLGVALFPIAGPRYLCTCPKARLRYDDAFGSRI